MIICHGSSMINTRSAFNIYYLMCRVIMQHKMDSTISKTWRKYKFSSSFSRTVKKNVESIINSKLVSVKQVPSLNRRILQHEHPTDQENGENSTDDNSSPHCPAEMVCSNDAVRAEGEDTANRENWLIELEDDDDEDEKVAKDESERTKNEQVREALKIWTKNFNIQHQALKEVMKIFNTRWPNILPVDPRTLLRTPVTVTLQKVGDGYYWHNGLENCLRNNFSAIQHLTSISININIDGLPIYRSSKDEFWPILFNIHEVPHVPPMVIGIYNGKRKPSDLSAYISPFVEEAKTILSNGIRFDNGKCVQVKIRCFICDSPARAFIKGVANFNGQHGCLKCTTVGEYSYITHCNIFPKTDCPNRTDQGFRSKSYEGHHKCYTPLEQLPIDMINDFPIADSLHLIDLGITKRCLMGWRDGSFRNFRMKWSANDTLNISKFLQSCKMPSEIHRAVRGLDCLSHWKGLEYRTFLHYIGIVVLKDYLPSEVYAHFLLFFCAITICSSTFYSRYLDVADQLLQHYIEQYKEIYGEEYMTSNVHNIAHLVDDVRNFGILSTFSSYPFESKLYQIKNMLRHSRNPLVQVAKRLTEFGKIESEVTRNENVFPKLERQNDGEGIDYQSLLQIEPKPKFFFKIKLNDFTLTTEMKNKWFLTKDNTIVGLKNIILFNNTIRIYGSSLIYQTNYFETPIKSSYLGIFVSNLEENEARLYKISDIKCKLVSVIHSVGKVIFVPLLHTL